VAGVAAPTRTRKFSPHPVLKKTLNSSYKGLSTIALGHKAQRYLPDEVPTNPFFFFFLFPWPPDPLFQVRKLCRAQTTLIPNGT